MVDVALRVHEHRGAAAVEMHHCFTRRKHRPDNHRSCQESMMVKGSGGEDKIRVRVSISSALRLITRIISGYIRVYE